MDRPSKRPTRCDDRDPSPPETDRVGPQPSPDRVALDEVAAGFQQHGKQPGRQGLQASRPPLATQFAGLRIECVGPKTIHVSSPPLLNDFADVVIDGVERKIVAQPTKQAWLYVFDRETGEPIWPIEERAVEASDVPGELLSRTQPFPTKPPAYDRQGVDLDDLVDFTPEIRRRAEEIAARHRLGPIFTPPVVSDSDGPYGTLMLPSQTGGTNWPGGSIDPETGIAYLSFTRIGSLRLINDPERSDMNYISGSARDIPAAQAALNVDGIPLVKPPWGRITAIDLKRGEILWQIAHGATADNIRNHPLLEGVTVPRTGRIGRVGTLITKTLVIAGEAGTFTTESGEEGAMLRAYDKASGEELGAVFMPAGVSGSPMTYMHGDGSISSRRSAAAASPAS